MGGNRTRDFLLDAGSRCTDNQPFSQGLLRGKELEPDLVVLSADLSKYTDVIPFAERYPEFFIQVGMAEANMMGIAGGLSKSGLRPVAVTYCVFAARRAFEQVAMALGTGGNGAVIAAFLPGITTPFTATHQGTDDLAIMRQVPNMTIIDPMDSTELAAATEAAIAHQGPVYLRGLRGVVDRFLDPQTHDFRIGEAYQLLGGADLGVMSTGLGTQWALEGLELLRDRNGLQASLLHIPTIKPLDTDAVRDFCSRFPVVVSLENHSIVGGLGSSISEVITDHGLGTRLVRLGIPPRWAGAGSLDYLRRTLGLDADSLADQFLGLANGQR